MFMWLSKKVAPRPPKPTKDELPAKKKWWVFVTMVSIFLITCANLGYIPNQIGLIGVCFLVKTLREFMCAYLPEVPQFERKGWFTRFIEEEEAKDKQPEHQKKNKKKVLRKRIPKTTTTTTSQTKEKSDGTG
eukprot:TRINITY_DN5197_c5_g1_i1.p1 TRINITY_DN5197_c5_g1~~TRINITY_DN5197_c5_g1_i1.p1  ORF type:complete len:132 (+),score=30.33 TRINITY_DN5197_c5_g1_i1:96-491(+)